jgi:hypothetical protein
MVVIGGFWRLDTLCGPIYIATAMARGDDPVAQVHRETFAGAAALVTASQHFRLHDFTVILRNDCQPALAALRKGSYRSPILQDIAIEHAEFCMQLGINAPLTLFAPGDSLIAEGIDGLSRDAVQAERRFESSPVLRDFVQSVARDQGWTVTIDLFANSENTLLPRFFSRFPDRFSEVLDALSQPSWRRSSCPHCRNCHDESVFLFPPLGLWPSVPRKAKASGARGVLVAPLAIISAIWQRPALIAASLTRPASRNRCVKMPPAVAGDPAGPRWAVLAFDFSAHVPRATPLTPTHAACSQARKARPARSIASAFGLADRARIASALDGIGPRPPGFPAANGGRSPSPRLPGGSDHDSWRLVRRQGPVVTVQGDASHQLSGRPPMFAGIWRPRHDSHAAQRFSPYPVGGRGGSMALCSPPGRSHSGR